MAEKRLKDYVKVVRPEDVAAHLVALEKEIEAAAISILPFRQLGEASRVFPYLLMAVARQIRILSISESGPIEMAAGACVSFPAS